jgi:hypothetical protein
MKEDLNLLPSVAKFQAAKIKLRKTIRLSMSLFLGVWVLFMVVVFVWLGMNNLLLNRAKKENTIALGNYKSLMTNVVLSKKNKYQAKLVGKVLSERFEYGVSINKITKMFSDNVNVENFEIKNKKQFILKGILIRGVNMLEVEEKVRDINLGLLDGFESAKLNSVNIVAGGWEFEMEVDLI